MFFRSRPRHRRFDYEPRFYDPTEDDRLRRRLRFTSRTRRGGRPSLLFLVILLILILLLFWAF